MGLYNKGGLYYIEGLNTIYIYIYEEILFGPHGQ